MANQLPTAQLGTTGISVYPAWVRHRPLAPGAKPIGPRKQRTRSTTRVLDKGINFIDTAFDYMYAEEWIGQSLNGRYRDFALATKCGCTATRPEANNSDHLWTRGNPSSQYRCES